MSRQKLVNRPCFTNLELTASAKYVVDNLAKRNGMTRNEVMERIFTWFSRQSELLSSAIVGDIPKSVPHHVMSLLAKSISRTD